MHQPSRIRHFAALALLLALIGQVAASNDQELEGGLIAALTLKQGTTERVGNSGKAILAYMREGVVRQRPNLRVDYADYYLVNRPVKFMGHEFVVIEEEYMSRYVGCCVSPGVGVSVRVVGASKNLEDFAQKNGCTLTDNIDIQSELRYVGIKANLPKGHFATLSCRERDAKH